MKRVNRRFTNPLGTPIPSAASSFEDVVQELNLAPDQYVNSSKLRDWVLRHKDEKYVPSEVLKAFGFENEDE